MSYDRATLFAAFMLKVKLPANLDGCWEWTGSRPQGRYGHFGVRGEKAHRWLYEFVNGPLAAGVIVRHRCDNPGCVNPRRLLSGTLADNSRDMVARARNPDRRGTRHPMAKITADDVVDIRARAALGERHEDIAAVFGIARSHVGKITRRDSWRHV